MNASSSANQLRLSDIIGHDLIRENLDIMISAARKRRESLGHILFYGQSGMGKSTLANAIANEIGVKITSIAGYSVEKPSDLAAIITNLHAHDILFIDEIHRLKQSLEEILCDSMENLSLSVVIGKGPSAKVVQLKLPPFTVVGSTTRLSSVAPSIQKCFQAVFRLEPYKDKEIHAFLRRAGSLLPTPLDQSVIDEITRRAHGNPHIAIRLLKWLNDYAHVRANGLVNLEVAKAAFALMKNEQYD